MQLHSQKPWWVPAIVSFGAQDNKNASTWLSVNCMLFYICHTCLRVLQMVGKAVLDIPRNHGDLRHPLTHKRVPTKAKTPTYASCGEYMGHPRLTPLLVVYGWSPALAVVGAFYFCTCNASNFCTCSASPSRVGLGSASKYSALARRNKRR